MDTKLENLVKDYLISTCELYQYGVNICDCQIDGHILKVTFEYLAVAGKDYNYWESEHEELNIWDVLSWSYLKFSQSNSVIVDYSKI